MTKLRGFALACVLWALPLFAHAQNASDDPTASRSTTFQAVSGPTTEDVPGGPLLIGAYGAILVLMIGYVMWLGRLQSGTARELAALRRELDRANKSVAGKS
jgi:hypothetical protein